MTTGGYERWRQRLAGEKVMTYPQPETEDCGWYRKPITVPGTNAKTGQRNGKNVIVGWEPVKYYMSFGGDQLCGTISGVDMTANEVDSIWTWCCRYPISEELYIDVVELGKPWPDVPASDREVSKSDNASTVECAADKHHAEVIDAAISAAIKTVASDEDAAKALGSKNRIAELRLAADKAGKAIYEPIYRTYTAEQKKWSPIIARATAKEKELNTAILTFRESERRRIAAEQAEADRKQHEIEEANQRAADRAIARGEPELPPVVEEVAPIVAANPIVPTYGTKKIKEELHTILDAITDYDAVYQFLKGEPDVKALLLKLATAKVKAGFTVPGCTTRQGLI